MDTARINVYSNRAAATVEYKSTCWRPQEMRRNALKKARFGLNESAANKQRWTKNDLLRRSTHNTLCVSQSSAEVLHRCSNLTRCTSTACSARTLISFRAVLHTTSCPRPRSLLPLLAFVLVHVILSLARKLRWKRERRKKP